jgi:F-type H+-transporting ATPase subunit delta
LSKNKGFSDTTAGRYSLALYELAGETNSIDEIEKNSSAVIKLISSSNDFNSFIKDPTYKKEDQLKTIIKISEQYKLNNLLTKFLSFLISKRRLFYVDKILKAFIGTCLKKRGEIKAELTAAKELTENEINSIKEDLTKSFSSKIKLNYKYDPSLIGGLIVQVGSTMVDASIKNKLQQIENRMIET